MQWRWHRATLTQEAHLGPGLDLGQLQRLVGKWSSAIFCRLQDTELQAGGVQVGLTARWIKHRSSQSTCAVWP